MRCRYFLNQILKNMSGSVGIFVVIFACVQFICSSVIKRNGLDMQERANGRVLVGLSKRFTGLPPIRMFRKRDPNVLNIPSSYYRGELTHLLRGENPGFAFRNQKRDALYWNACQYSPLTCLLAKKKREIVKDYDEFDKEKDKDYEYFLWNNL